MSAFTWYGVSTGLCAAAMTVYYLYGWKEQRGECNSVVKRSRICWNKWRKILNQPPAQQHP